LPVLSCVLAFSLCAGAGRAPAARQPAANARPPVARVAVLPFVAGSELSTECLEGAWRAVVQALRKERLAVVAPEEALATARAVGLDPQLDRHWTPAEYERFCRKANVQFAIRGVLTARAETRLEAPVRSLADDYQPDGHEAVRYVRAEAHLLLVGAGSGSSDSREARHTDRERVGNGADAGRLRRKTYIACRDAARYALRKLGPLGK
jgi:hypothetical protein